MRKQRHAADRNGRDEVAVADTLEPGGDIDQVAPLRERLVNGLLITVSLVSVPALPLSLGRVAVSGWQPAHYVQIAALVVLLVLTAMRRHVPFLVRTLVFLVLLSINGAVGMASYGLAGGGMDVLAMVPVCGVLLLGLRAGWLFLAASLLISVAAKLAFDAGVLVLDFDLDAYAASYGAWATRLVASGGLAALVILSYSYIDRSLRDVIDRLARTGRELRRSNDAKDRAIAELTELKQSLERRVDEQTADLRQAKDAAEAANRAKSDFLSVISHELRTPLTVVLGYAKMLANLEKLPQVTALHDKASCAGAPGDGLDEEVRAMCERVQAMALKMDGAGEHLLALINDLLDFSKIEAGRMELSPAPLAASPIVAAVLAHFEGKAAAKGLHLVADVPGDIVVVADEMRFRQILINLIGNGVKFTAQGRVAVSAVVASGGFVEFRVRDTGPGIADADSETVFEKFRQLESSTTRQSGGTGLGLAITRRLVEAHGGTISVRNPADGGAEFVFTLPAAPVGDTAS